MNTPQKFPTLAEIQTAAKAQAGSAYAPAMATITKAINSTVDTHQLGITETYVLICKTMKTDPLTSMLIMAAAAEQVQPNRVAM